MIGFKKADFEETIELSSYGNLKHLALEFKEQWSLEGCWLAYLYQLIISFSSGFSDLHTKLIVFY